MARIASYYIQEERIQIVHAERRGGELRVLDAVTVAAEDLDEQLLRERCREVVVSRDFRTASQENLHIPPVKRRLVRPLLVSKLRKTRGPSGDYAVVSFRTGVKNVEGRTLEEHFVYSVETEEIDELVTSFLARKKEVSRLYPEMLAVLKVLPPGPAPYLFLYEGAGRKHFFLIRDGSVLFTRSIQALNEGISDYDIQNINMTVSYCRQTPGLSPEKVLCLGGPELLEGTTVEPAAPIEFLEIPEGLRVEPERFREYIVPIAALLGTRVPDIFSEGYRRLRSALRVVRRGTAAFAGLSVLLLLLFGMHLRQFRALENELRGLQARSGDLRGIVNGYNTARERLARAERHARFLQERLRKASAARFLARLGRVENPAVDVHLFELRPAEQGLRFVLEGDVESKGLFRKQQDLDRAVAGLRSLPGMSGVEGRLSVRDSRFRIEGDYEEGG